MAPIHVIPIHASAYWPYATFDWGFAFAKRRGVIGAKHLPAVMTHRLRKPDLEEVEMLSQASVAPTIAVRDLAKARQFYEGSLGLKELGTEGDDTVFYESGNSKILVYRSQYAGTNEATAMSWEVDDIDAEIRDLKAKGIAFEHYNMPGARLEGDVHVIGGIKEAWFKDPDGNILNLSSH